jgi:hypothetical protein
MAGGLFTAKPCRAASAEVEIAADTTEVTEGDTIFVYIRITSDTLFGNFEANLIYNDDVFEYMGGASVITGNSGFLKISDMGVTEGTDSRKYTLKFEALQVGTSEISFSNRAVVYDFEADREMSVSSNVLTLNVIAPVTASTNTNLQSLKTNPVEIAPEFSQSIFEYNVNVGYETEKLIITALPEDPSASVSIKGNDSLLEGENKVVVTVLAESGDDIEYTINVFREYAPEEEMVPDEPVISPGANQGLFEVVKIDGEKYAVYSGKYKLVEPEGGYTVPKGYVQTGMIISGVSITAFYPEGNMDSEFLLIYARNELGDEGFYRYDKIEKTLQRYITENNAVYEDTDSDYLQENMDSKEYRDNLNKAAIVIAVLCALCGFVIFISIRLYLRLKGHNKDDLD